jgi:putative flippase GtrA
MVLRIQQAAKQAMRALPKNLFGLLINALRTRAKSDLYPILRFITFGLIAVVLDLVTFSAFLAVGLTPNFAKAAGYSVALAFTLKYLLPGVFRSTNNPARFFGAMFIYLSTGVMNVTTFSLVAGATSALAIAFLAGTAVSASVNYFSIKILITKTMA